MKQFIKLKPTYYDKLLRKAKHGIINNNHSGVFRYQALETNNPLENRMKVLLDDLKINYTYQAIIGNYRVDFLEPISKTCIETDGIYHENQVEKDVKRDAWLKSQGYKVLHIPANAVFNAPDQVKTQLASLLLS